MVPREGERQEVLAEAVWVQRFQDGLLGWVRRWVADGVVGEHAVRRELQVQPGNDVQPLSGRHRPRERGGEHGPVHRVGRGGEGPRGRVDLVAALSVQPCPVQMFAVQEVAGQPGEVGRRATARDVGVDSDQGREVYRKGQPEVVPGEGGGCFDTEGRDAVPGGEAVMGDSEHLRPRRPVALPLLRPVGQRRQELRGRSGLEVGNGGADGGPDIVASGQQQDARGHLGLVQQGVAEQPQQVRQRPAVGVVDDQQGAVRSGAEILAAGRRNYAPGAVRGGDHLPAVVRRFTREVVGEPGFPLPAWRVQPPHSELWPLVSPSPQRCQLRRPAGELHNGETGVEHAARHLAQERVVGGGRRAPPLKQVHRYAIAEDVDVRADNTIGKAVLGADGLCHGVSSSASVALAGGEGYGEARWWTCTLLPGPSAPYADPPPVACTLCCQTF